MKNILMIMIYFLTLNAVANVVNLNKDILDGTSVPFVKNEGKGQWDNYLIMNLPYDPAKELYKEVMIQEKIALINRGEAHITVITPVEFWNVLKPIGVTMQDIQKIAEKNNIQSSEFKVVCLAMGKKTIDQKEEKTFYVVVESAHLLKIRQEVEKLYISKKGNPELFKAQNFYPHITIGFSKRDLHESDGVIKDQASCAKEIILK